MAKIKRRESNIELLRVISMLFIVVYHFIIHSVIPNSTDLGYRNTPIIYVLHIGVVCFVLISGFWGIRFTIKGFLRLFLYCSFYSVLLYAAHTIMNPELFRVTDLIKATMPDQWWFIPVFLCLYLLTPLINIPLRTKSKQSKLFFIVILFIISFGFGQFVPSLSEGKNPLNFVLIYYIGNYLRTGIKLPPWWNASKLLYLYLVCNTLLLVLLSFDYTPFITHLIFLSFFSYNGIGLILNSSLFFLIFTKLKFHSRWINWVSSSTLAVYLLHENEYVGSYLYDFIVDLHNTTNSSVLFSFSLVSLGVAVFVVAVLIDKLLSPVFRILFNLLINTKMFTKINDKGHKILKLNQTY